MSVYVKFVVVDVIFLLLKLDVEVDRCITGIVKFHIIVYLSCSHVLKKQKRENFYKEFSPGRRITRHRFSE